MEDPRETHRDIEKRDSASKISYYFGAMFVGAALTVLFLSAGKYVMAALPVTGLCLTTVAFWREKKRLDQL